MAISSAEWTVLSMLEWATGYFDKKGIRNPRLSIEWLLSEVLEVKRLDLYLMHDRPLTSFDLEKLKPFILRRAKHEPLQYIIGFTDFFGLTFSVDQNVLIPRPETEQLVELVLNEFDNQQTLKIIDIGTGSGCIPISLKSQKPNWNLSAVDISDKALTIAKQNSIRNNVDVEFRIANLFMKDQFPEMNNFDVLISNPPYVLESEKTTLDDEVIRFEPSEALFCESTEGIYTALRILAEKIIKIEGTVFLELNERFGKQVNDIFSTKNWQPKLIKDYGSKDRFLVAKKVQ